MNVKKLFQVSHRWFGLIAGLHFVLLGISGSYLVYPEFFEKLLFPHRYEIQGEWDQLATKDVVESTQEKLGITHPPVAIAFPERKDQSIQITYNLPEERTRLIVFYDPVADKILDQVGFLQTWRGWLFKFHHDLFMGGTGRTIMGVSGVLCMILLLSGLYLWWPKRSQVKKAFTQIRTRSLLTFMLDSHQIIGFYTLLLMIMVTFTGLYISVPSWFDFSGESKRPRAARQADTEFDALAAFYLADEKFDKAGGLSVSIHPRSKRMSVSSNQGSFTFNKSEKVFEPNSPRAATTRRVMGDWHEGAFWGWLGPLLVFISGILPLFFYISGIYLWIKKSKYKVI